MPVRSRLVARFAPSLEGAPGAVRADVAATTPLELRGPFPASIPGTPPRYLLRNVTAGILDGDDYAIEVCAAPGTRVVVEPTSAAKVFRSRGGGATLRTRIEVMPGAELRYDSGLLIPHAGAILRQQTEIVLHESARASWSESLSFGRLSHDERFRFTRIGASCESSIPRGVCATSAAPTSSRNATVPPSNQPSAASARSARWSCWAGSPARSPISPRCPASTPLRRHSRTTSARSSRRSLSGPSRSRRYSASRERRAAQRCERRCPFENPVVTHK